MHLQNAEGEGEGIKIKAHYSESQSSHQRLSISRPSAPFGRFLQCTRGSATVSDDDEHVHTGGGGGASGGEHLWVELFDSERHEEAGKVCISSWESCAAVDPGAAARDAVQVRIQYLRSEPRAGIICFASVKPALMPLIVMEVLHNL